MNIFKKAIILTEIIFILMILISCGSHEIDGDKVYYISWNEANGKVKTLIKDADGATFKELEHSKYAIDKKNVYYQAGSLKGANPKTFSSLLDYYGKDDKYAYQGGSLIDGAEGKTFEIIDGGPFSKDVKDFYYDTIRLYVNDLKSFRILSDDWSKDKSHYYILGKKYPLADHNSFAKIEFGYAKDKYQVYFHDSVIVGADVNSFKIIEYGYAKDKF